MHVADNPHRHLGRVVDTGHCVRFVQVAAPSLGHTSTWRRGAKARSGDLAPGTVIATFDASGRYANATNGTSHAAVFLAYASDGLRVLDQWQGQPVHERLIRYRGGVGPAVNDADAYHIVMTG